MPDDVVTGRVVLEDLAGRRMTVPGSIAAKAIAVAAPCPIGAFLFMRTSEITPDLLRVYRQVGGPADLEKLGGPKLVERGVIDVAH